VIHFELLINTNCLYILGVLQSYSEKEYYVSKVSEIKEKIAEAKKRMTEQTSEVDKARKQWEEELDKSWKIQEEIYNLKDELKEAKQEAFDEDGMLLSEPQKI
jgi:uncharacterized coiled-coil DUF342 family protein